MAAIKKERDLARRLAIHLADNGEAAIGDVRAAIEKICASRHTAQRRVFIRMFLRDLARELRNRELLIEHAGPLADAQVAAIRQSFESLAGRALSLRIRENADLIAGVCVTLGDNVYDSSVAGQLARLERSVH